MVHLEYKHLEGDVPHGGCRVARFSFNLDRYELSIISDCGERAGGGRELYDLLPLG